MSTIARLMLVFGLAALPAIYGQDPKPANPPASPPPARRRGLPKRSM